MRRLVVAVLVAMILLPGLVRAEEVEAQKIEQIPAGATNYNYTSNATDFRDILSEHLSVFKTGIYSGPHLPPAKFALSYAGDVKLSITFQLGINVFVYGASDYYIYLPVLNSPGTVAMHITLDDFTFLDDDYFSAKGWYRDGMNYSVLAMHHLIYYFPDVGYILHNPFYPLTSNENHTLTIAIHPITDSPIIFDLMQEQSEIVKNLTLQIGRYINNDWNDFHSEKTVTAPLALAFLATEGITQFGLGAVTLPGNLGIYQYLLTASGDKYATIDMPFHFPAGDYVTINYTWDAPTRVYNKQVQAYVKNFVLQSTDTKIAVPSSGSYSEASFVVYPENEYRNYTVFVTVQKQHINLFLYDRTHTVKNPNAQSFDKNVSQYTWAYTDYASHIVTNLTLTNDRYVALNASNWEISRYQFALLAMQNAILLQYYDLEEHSKGPYATFLKYVASLGEAEELIKSGAHQLQSRWVGFSTYLNLFSKKLRNIGNIIWQTLLRFWGYIVHEAFLFWSWIAPVLQLAIYFVFVISLMVAMKYLGKILNRREESAHS